MHTSVCIQISIDLNSSNKPNDLCIAVPSSYVHCTTRYWCVKVNTRQTLVISFKLNITLRS